VRYRRKKVHVRYLISERAKTQLCTG